MSTSASDSSSDSSSSSSSSSDDDEKNAKKGKKKKKKKRGGKKKKKPKTENGEKEGNSAEKKESFYCTIRADEIPDVPTYKFLSRGVPEEDEAKRAANVGPESKNFVSKSGRKVKGRGALVSSSPEILSIAFV